MIWAHLPNQDIWLPGLALIGLFVGYVAGMFGVGGGFLLVPALMLLGVPPPIAVGSSTCQMCGTSLAAFLRYRQFKRGEPRIDLVMIGGSLIGVDAGARLLAWLETLGDWRVGSGTPISVVRVVLDILFFCLLLLITVSTLRDAWQASKRVIPRGDRTIPGPLVTRIRVPPFMDLPGVQLTQVSVPMMGYIGFILGLATGLMAVGAGVLLMPILVYGFGMSLRNAAGTGLLLLFVTVSLGTVEHSLRGNVDLRLAMAILIGSSVGSQLGALTTHYLPNRTLRLIFAGLVASTVFVVGWDILRIARGH